MKQTFFKKETQKNNFLIFKNNFKASERKSLKNKKAIELDMLAWWLIGIAILVIGVFVYFILTGKLTGGIDFIKNLFRFGSG